MIAHVEHAARSVAAKHPLVTGVLSVIGLVAVAEGLMHVLKPKTSTAQSTAGG
jgi:hypothetical protein